jgi:hypothetical protein
VTTFLSVVKDKFDGTCILPDYEKTAANVTSRGGGDFSPSFYEVNIRCYGKVSAIHITAEFSPPLGTPLNLVLSMNLRK